MNGIKRSTRLIARLSRAAPRLSSYRSISSRSQTPSILPGDPPETKSVAGTRSLKEDSKLRPLGTTVLVHNVPDRALLGEVVDLVIFGPLFSVDERVESGARVVSLTFFKPEVATAFFREVTERDVLLYGSRLQFLWGPANKLPTFDNPRSVRVRNAHEICVPTVQNVNNYFAQYGRIDFTAFLNDMNAFAVDFCSTESAKKAVHDLQPKGFKVSYGMDRCLLTHNRRGTAIHGRAKLVLLEDLPHYISPSRLSDHIRGGALRRLVVVPPRAESRQPPVAYVHFMEHEAALAFFNFALYHGIVIDNRRLIPKLKKEDPHKVAEAAFPPDTTRCVYLSDLDDPQNAVHQIRAELRNLNLSASLERITLSPSRTRATIAFLNLSAAATAVRLLPRMPPFRNMRAEFAPDPCAGPFPGTPEAARARLAQATGSEPDGPSSVVPPYHASPAKNERNVVPPPARSPPKLRPWF